LNKREALKRAKELTMGCWWNSRAFPKKEPDLNGIIGELHALYHGELSRGDNERANEIVEIVKAINE